MKNWKTKAVSTVLALSVLVPTTAFASDAITTKGDVNAKKGFAHHRFLDGERRQEADGKILELAGKYTPESLEEWKNTLAEQEQLKNDLMKKRPPVDKQRPQLSDEAKEKVKAIREDVKSGKLTPEEAREEMDKLGLKGREDFDKDNLMVQFREAVRANDETKIKELLPQMLQQLKEKNQIRANKLAESNK
ncbi:MAG: hypothetical protein ACOY40_00470 [Bacillota bacterium]